MFPTVRIPSVKITPTFIKEQGKRKPSKWSSDKNKYDLTSQFQTAKKVYNFTPELDLDDSFDPDISVEGVVLVMQHKIFEHYRDKVSEDVALVELGFGEVCLATLCENQLNYDLYYFHEEEFHTPFLKVVLKCIHHFGVPNKNSDQFSQEVGFLLQDAMHTNYGQLNEEFESHLEVLAMNEDFQGALDLIEKHKEDSKEEDYQDMITYMTGLCKMMIEDSFDYTHIESKELIEMLRSVEKEDKHDEETASLLIQMLEDDFNLGGIAASDHIQEYLTPCDEKDFDQFLYFDQRFMIIPSNGPDGFMDMYYENINARSGELTPRPVRNFKHQDFKHQDPEQTIKIWNQFIDTYEGKK
jgi:hypothetical protein